MSAISTPTQQPARLLARVGFLRAMPWWAQCIVLWLATLIVLTSVGILAVHVAQAAGDMGEGYSPWPNIAPEAPPGLWLRWDANYYLEIARDGYVSHPDARGFFPLYPLLIAVFSGVTGWNGALAGMLIAQLSYLVAILAFYKLARLIRDDHAFAMRCVAFMVLFPSAFFFYTLYAESVYLALAILGVYLIMRARPLYMRAGVSMALASLARPVGWLLNVIVVFEYWFRRRAEHPLSFWRTLVTLVITTLGTVVFVLYLYTITGTFTAITQSQALWRRHWNWPWLTIWNSIQIAFTGNRVPGNWFLYAINWMDLLFTLLALVLACIAIYRSIRGRFPWSLTLYLIVSLVFTLSSEGPYLTEASRLVVIPLWGMTRWVSALFPLFLLMGDLIGNRKLRWATVVASAVLLIAFTAWWTTGRWIS